MANWLYGALALIYATWGVAVVDSNTPFAVCLLGGAACLAATLFTTGMQKVIVYLLGYLFTFVIVALIISGN